MSLWKWRSSLRTIISYNEHEVNTEGSIDDLGNGYNVWIDLVDPDDTELLELANKFNLDAEAIQTYFNKSKKPEVRLLDNQLFTVILDMKNKDPKTLETEGIYFFLGRKWLISIHCPEVNLKQLVERLFKVKNKKIKEAPIAGLYYNVIAEIVTKYEQLLTALELTVNEYQRRSFVRPSPEIFDSIDTLSRQTIILRRYFWRVRSIINFLVHNEHDKEEVKYIEMVYDDISQLIDFVESYEGTINSIRELYVAKVSLQINDTMKVLTIFTVILLPLGLITGIYGMNGLDLNKLDSLPAGFILVIITMVCVGGGLLFFFIKKQWLFVREQEKREPANAQKTTEHTSPSNNKDSHITYRVWKRGNDTTTAS
jgi:magnesium transporter